MMCGLACSNVHLWIYGSMIMTSDQDPPLCKLINHRVVFEGGGGRGWCGMWVALSYSLHSSIVIPDDDAHFLFTYGLWPWRCGDIMCI